MILVVGASEIVGRNLVPESIVVFDSMVNLVVQRIAVF